MIWADWVVVCTNAGSGMGLCGSGMGLWGSGWAYGVVEIYLSLFHRFPEHTEPRKKRSNRSGANLRPYHSYLIRFLFYFIFLNLFIRTYNILQSDITKIIYRKLKRKKK